MALLFLVVALGQVSDAVTSPSIGAFILEALFGCAMAWGSISYFQAWRAGRDRDASSAPGDGAPGL